MQPEFRPYPNSQSQVPDSVRSEVSALLALTATGEETIEERSRRNAALREMLASTSNHSIAFAVRMGGLVERELWVRMQRGDMFPIAPLFDIACDLASYGFGKKSMLSKLGLITDAVKRYAPTAPKDEVIKAIDCFSVTVINRDTHLLEHLLLSRPDGAEIIEEMVAATPESPVNPEFKRNREDHLRYLWIRAQRLKRRSSQPHP